MTAHPRFTNSRDNASPIPEEAPVTNANFLELNYSDTDEDFYASLNQITPLVKLVEEYCPDFVEQDKLFCMEMLIWSLAINKKLDKTNSEKSFSF